MFKWIIIFTLFNSNGKLEEHYQVDSQFSYRTEDECMDRLAHFTNQIQSQSLERQKQAEINHASCFFISALGKPGVSS